MPHLRAVERARVSNADNYYLVAFHGERPIGIGHFFVIDMDFASLSSGIDADTLATLRRHDAAFMRMRTVECGFVAGLGEAIAAVPEHWPRFLDILVNALEDVARSSHADVLLVRDIPLPDVDACQPLRARGFDSLFGFPPAVIPIAWNCFDAYVASLKSEHRRRVRKARLKLRQPGMRAEAVTAFATYAEEMLDLWQQTNSRATSYQHEALNARYFCEISNQLGVRSEAILIHAEGKLVGMAVCLLGDEEYFLAHVGLSCDRRSGDEVYRNLCYLGLERAINGGYRRFNMGITTYDLKFDVGAASEPLVYFVKHAGHPEYTPTLARLLARSIAQPENTHRPFSDQERPLGPSPGDLATVKRAWEPASLDSDVFQKAWHYDRAREGRLAKLYSFFPVFESAQTPVVQHEGRPVVMLGSNSYLGLATHPDVQAAAHEAIERFGTGCSGSPLLNGTLDIHVDLARELAEFMRKDDALLFSTGYQTNIGVVSALLGDGDVAIIDELDHASLLDGVLLSRCRFARYKHNDMGMLEEVLARHKDRPKLIIADSVFSMEGTIANVPEIVRLARKYGARLMLDEAHAVGVLGPGGRGAAELFGLLEEVDLVMGTFSKSFASAGGFVAGNRLVIDFLRSSSRSHIFSASLPPPAVAAARRSLEIIRSEPERRTRLFENARLWSAGLIELGFDAPFHGTPVIPVHQCRNDQLTLGLFKKLLEEGVFVNPVLPPAVARGGQLLRTSLMATHDANLLQRALDAFARVRTPEFPREAMSAKTVVQSTHEVPVLEAL
ncbi:MAG TPA: aminotransferase class I/II-fold pyridoxal phosphate-dependent enzyme [Thermoanaerobaculia bacterium]|nr:aminotransferase class I/II-fold pyridoxal phosphate-dependent enzyme [Thermoanaerobaculia bacterium]